MKTKIFFFCIAVFFLEGCTPSMNLRVKCLNIDTAENDFQLHFEFLKEKKDEIKPLDLQRVWIYKDDRLLLDMEKLNSIDDVQHIWDFPSVPKGFKITFPENLNALPAFSKNDHLKFEFLAGGSYSQWEHKPNS